MVAASEALARIVPSELRELLRARPLVLRRPVRGARHGLHRSARPGLGLDFRDHRAYVPGDDLRRLDWRAAARRDRLVLRQTEAEDELPVVLVCDLGANMRYGDGATEKLTTLRALAGGLAWMALRQGDRVGLVSGGARADVRLVRPAGGHERAAAIAHALAAADGSGVAHLAPLLGEIAPRLPPRSLVVVLSDLLDLASADGDADTELDATMRGLAHLRARGHEVLVLQIVHRDELELPFPARTMMRFIDPTGRREPHEGPPDTLRHGYLVALHRYLNALARRCETEGLLFERMVTDEPVATAFVGLLARLAGGAPAEPVRLEATT